LGAFFTEKSLYPLTINNHIQEKTTNAKKIIEKVLNKLLVVAGSSPTLAS
jgi:hypothetical protein